MKHSFLFAAALAALFAAPALAQEAPARGHSKIEFLRTYDTDLDGAVSREEFNAQRAQDYARTDSDGSGALSESEYVGEYATRLDAQIAEMRERQITQAHSRFGVLDTDDDQSMTQTEFDASGARIFGALDTNGDGRVDDGDTADGF